MSFTDHGLGVAETAARVVVGGVRDANLRVGIRVVSTEAGKRPVRLAEILIDSRDRLPGAAELRRLRQEVERAVGEAAVRVREQLQDLAARSVETRGGNRVIRELRSRIGPVRISRRGVRIVNWNLPRSAERLREVAGLLKRGRHELLIQVAV